MNHGSKVKRLSELAGLLDQLREEGPRKIVHCHGVFDLLHIGHIRYLQTARNLGDLLVVTLTPDEFVNKGPHRPAFGQDLRVDALAALDCVDYVAVNDSPTASQVIRRLRPDVYAKGAEFRDHKTPELLAEEDAAREVGAAVEFIEEVTSSSSHLINEYLSPFDDEVDCYLDDLRERYQAADVLAHLERAAELKVLVVGEAIIDEYYLCSTMGQSSKAPIIATRYESHQRFAGGTLAIANHLAAFCQNVDLIAMLGGEDSQEDWIRSQLRPAVAPRFHYKQDSPTIVKRRYRESYFGVPLFAINFLNDQPPSDLDEDSLCRLLDDALEEYDLVIVADYGHQMLTKRARRLLCDKARFLAVNTQSNAANIGFHAISKYPRADYVSLADRELRLECRSPGGDAEQLLMEVGKRLYATTVSVTLGSRGSLCYSRRAGFARAPSLATKVVDRVGAGDAYLAITALCAAVDAPLDVLALLGNVAGAEAVAVVGTSPCLDAVPLQRHVESLFK